MCLLMFASATQPSGSWKGLGLAYPEQHGATQATGALRSWLIVLEGYLCWALYLAFRAAFHAIGIYMLLLQSGLGLSYRTDPPKATVLPEELWCSETHRRRGLSWAPVLIFCSL